MPIAVFANKVFQVDSNKIYTFDNFQYTSALQTEKQDSAGKKPSTYNKGPDLDTLSFTIKLSTEMGVNPRNEWGSWKTLLNSGVAYPFILGGAPLNNAKWLLIEVTPSNFIFDNTGKILSLDLSLQFQEYVRPGKAEASSTSGTAAKKSPGISSSDSQRLMQLINGEDKSQVKRQNYTMAEASWNRGR